MGFFKKKQPKEKPYLWVVPRVNQLLQDNQQSTPGQIYDGEALARFFTAAGFPCKNVKTTTGASVATYHFKLDNVLTVDKVKKVIVPLEAELSCDITMGKSDTGHFSIMIPRKERETVHLNSVLKSTEFKALINAYTNENIYNANIPMCLGTDTEGRALCVDLAELPHTIISGSTGSGKSVLVNSMITSTLFAKAPSQLQYILIDPKSVEYSMFEGIPHLFGNNDIPPQVITDTRQAIYTLNYMVQIMEQRYTQLKQMGKRDIEGTKFSRIVIVVDEFSDIILSSKRAVEESVLRIAQKGRAAGLHCIISTQQPRAEVLTGIIRANLPSRISLKTATATDSRISLGYNMAEKLQGRGDSIFIDPKSPGDFKRFQAAWISPQDISKVTAWWKDDTRCKEYQQ